MLLSPDVTELTRLKGRMLHDACRDLGIGQTSQGARRYFSDIEAAVLVLATRLGAQGMRRAETLIVAEEAKPELSRLLRNPASARRWLFAHLNDDGWTVEVVADTGSPELFDDDGANGFVAINLRSVVRAVLAAGR
jgi:hypothetical protein